jgi:hypothetical protein
LEDLEPVVTSLQVEKNDGSTLFAVRAGAARDADALLARAGRALGVSAGSDDEDYSSEDEDD